jgi:hypothetical protein
MAMGLQERIESRPKGQLAISVAIVVTSFAVLIALLPDSLLREQVSKATGPYLEVTGLDQRWRIFAPVQRPFSLRLEARVRYDDGRVGVWRPPRGGDLIGGYRDYRWAKWFEHVADPNQRRALWRPAAEFAVRELRRPGHRARSVSLVRLTQQLEPPGAPGPDRGPWRRETLYTRALP